MPEAGGDYSRPQAYTKGRWRQEVPVLGGERPHPGRCVWVTVVSRASEEVVSHYILPLVRVGGEEGEKKPTEQRGRAGGLTVTGGGKNCQSWTCPLEFQKRGKRWVLPQGAGRKGRNARRWVKKTGPNTQKEGRTREDVSLED